LGKSNLIASDEGVTTAKDSFMNKGLINVHTYINIYMNIHARAYTYLGKINLIAGVEGVTFNPTAKEGFMHKGSIYKYMHTYTYIYTYLNKSNLIAGVGGVKAATESLKHS